MGGIGSGGARDGAGRRPLDGSPRVKISVSVPEWLLSIVRDEADRLRVPTSQYITYLITKGLEE